MTGMVVLTATGADVKLVNRLLLYLKDWEYGAGYMFKVLCTHNEATHVATQNERDEPPLQSFGVNEWEGHSISQVERVMMQKSDAGGSAHLFLLLDDEGVRDRTIIVAKRAYDFIDKEIKYLRKFNKVRVPWEEAYIMWCNLNIANMDFWDFCIEDHHSETTDHWARYHGTQADGYYDEYIDRTEAVIKQLKKLDLA